MNIFNWPKNNEKKVLEALQEKDLKRRDEEIDVMKRLNKRINLITTKGDVEIIIRNVRGVIKELQDE